MDAGYHMLCRTDCRTAVKCCQRPVVGIAMSGCGMEDEVRQSREAGFVEHLVQPVSLAQLREAIRRVARTRES
jgi:CheY-like chemotaxis protein